MIHEFIASWTLFYNTYLMGWLISLLLALVGVLVVARDQIFIGAAVSQASTLGIALALGVGSWTATDALEWLHADAFLSAMAVVFSILAALLTARGGEDGKESYEAVTGWVFLASASGAILIVSHSPHGLDEIHRLLSSSIIGATQRDIWTFSALVIVTAVALAASHRRVLLFALDPAMAAAVGMRLKPWVLITSAWLGLAVGLSIRSAGMLYTFGCLVLPALVAKNVCRLDPILLTMGQAVLGNMGGRLRWVDADLMMPEWVGKLGESHVDAVLSTTALHWLAPEYLTRVSRELGQLLRPGGVFLNGDNLKFGPHLPSFQKVAQAMQDRTHVDAFERQGLEDWERWWEALQAESSLRELFAERERRFGWKTSGWHAPIFDLHVAALRDADFREVGVIWQNMENRILMAVR